MKILIQILFILLTWINLSATPAFSKVAFPNYAIYTSKASNQNLESKLNPNTDNLSRIEASKNYFSQKIISIEKCGLHAPACAENVTLYSKEWETVQAKLSAISSVPYSIYGFCTGTDFKSGLPLTGWDHVLNTLNVIPFISGASKTFGARTRFNCCC